ncbi:hypothetical protein CC117_23475 [Parafrankia colletiae]|uniref:Flavin reductase like domain-containing protein n=1 Tax=Parafrankia colletiae TaxID=573497 RepID=A0A1S1QJA3_9ACTN|nr:flavin reductase family protein [Parafrankia colletiae]MCK9902326.1 flavin reductase family protein [Frankia sp. Cpl3]OHV33142.1 hypothetical protein CC117_23475 [Parafrankia colletiae]
MTVGPGSDGRRDAVRRLSTGVTVLTVRHGDVVHGTTVSSVLAVSRDPLLVGVSLRRGSLTSDLAVTSGMFVVNVLSRRQALLADWFADPDRPAGLAQFDRLDWRPDAGCGAPRLAGAVAAMSCRLQARLTTGDHDLHVAEVVEGTVGTGSPLISYAAGVHGAELHEVTRRRGRRPLTGAAATGLD